jgi:hypothetical protein
VLVDLHLDVADEDHDVAVAEPHAQGAREPLDPLGVALTADERVEKVAPQHLAVARDALRLGRVGARDRRRRGVHPQQHVAGDRQRRFALGGHVDLRRRDDRGPHLAAEQPDGMQERLHRDALVHAPGGGEARRVELLVRRRRPGDQVVEQRLHAVKRDRIDLVAHELVAGEVVVGDLVLVAGDRVFGQRFLAILQP